MDSESLDFLESAMEAVLFAAGEPVELEKLAELLEVNTFTAQAIAVSLRNRLDMSGGIMLLMLEDKLQLATKPDMAVLVKRALETRRDTPLSQPAMEVLSVVAYRQPVTKAYIEQTRGVDCSGPLATLMSRGLIEEKGRLELPGRPLIYGTTDTFLRCFGLSSAEELPDLEAADESLPQEDSDESQMSLTESTR